MNVSSKNEATPSWWVEVYASVSQQIYHLGPFDSQEEAKISRGAYVEDLYHKETGDIVALVKQH